MPWFTGRGGGYGSLVPERPRVCVFAPAPLLTVTIEKPSADRGDGEVHLHAGGQGYWIARMLLRLDVDVVLCAALGGETGPILRRLMADEGIRIVGVAAGSNGAYVHDRRSGRRVEVAAMPALTLSRHSIDDLYSTTLVEALTATITVLSGPEDGAVVLPDDFYRRLTVDVRTNGGRVVADLSGDRLDAVVAGGVDVIKVSEEELERDGLLARTGSVDAAMRHLVEAGAGNVIVSHGDERASALDRRGDRAGHRAGPRTGRDARRRRLADRGRRRRPGPGRLADGRAAAGECRRRVERHPSRPRERRSRPDRAAR